MAVDSDRTTRLATHVLNANIPGTALGAEIVSLLERWAGSDKCPDLADLPEPACEANDSDPRLAAPISAAWRLVLRCQIRKSAFSQSDHLWLVLLSSRVRYWKDAFIFQPDTLLRWHRQGLRLFWTFKSPHRGGRPRLSTDKITLIRQMAKENLLWGAERIRGELLKLDIHVANATIQKYIRLACPARPSGQTWSVFLNNHAKDVWACDFLPVIDLLFRQVYVLH